LVLAASQYRHEVVVAYFLSLIPFSPSQILF